MKRRAFIAALGSAAAWPVMTYGEVMPVVGYLGSSAAEGASRVVGGFLDGLREGGFIVGQNVDIDYRWAEGQYDRLPALAAELVQRPATVIMASGTFNSALAAKAATTTIPIVFVNGSDAVALGLVASINKPGGNVTGVSNYNALLGAKRLGLLFELVPKTRMVAFLLNEGNPSAEIEARDASAAAQANSLNFRIVRARGVGDLEGVVATINQLKPDALMVGSDAVLTSERTRVVKLLSRCNIPVIYTGRDFIYVGGLMSYGANLVDSYREGGIYITKILKGTKPADLPVLEPTKYELVINLRTAKSLGLEIPPTLLARADEVIE